MKILLTIIIVFSLTMSSIVKAANLKTCLQHGTPVGTVWTTNNNATVAGQMCFDKYKEKPESKNSEKVKKHDIYSPECWKSKVDPIGIGGGGL